MSEKANENATPKGFSASNRETGTMTPEQAAQAVSSGKIRLVTPIMDGDKEYTELAYDFNKLTGWELARAIDTGADLRTRNSGNISDREALCLFSAAAAKCNELDARDVQERIGPVDAILAINTASVFFRGSLMAGYLRIASE